MSSQGRYLSPEPMTQSPPYLRHTAQGGMSVPTYAYAANNPVRYVDPDGLTTLTFYISTGWLQVDPEVPGRSPYLVPPTSGANHPGAQCMNVATNTCMGSSEGGPIPEGYYELLSRELSHSAGPGFLVARSFFRGDWGSFRVPLHATQVYPNNPFNGRTWSGRGGFYLHGGWKPGSWGCIDIGGGILGDDVTRTVVGDILRDPDGYVPVTVWR